MTGQILSECSEDVRQIKAAIIKVDKKQHLVKYSEKAPLIVDIAKSVNVGWSRLWDLTSELGLKAVSGLQLLAENWVTVVKDSGRATFVMLDLCKKLDSLTIF